MPYKLAFALSCLALGLTCSTAAEQISSQPAQTPLVELFTSQGCSSCPAADAWLSSLRDTPRLWRDYVPVAFHVDYWDQIGWPDPFASRANSERQRQYAAVGAARAVYTPGLFVAGREWRGWFRRQQLPAPATGPAAVSLQADIHDGVGAVQVDPALPDDRARVHVVLLGFDQHTQVLRGENAGRRLQHDFVALEHYAAPLDRGRARFAFGTRCKPDQRYALAAWVETQPGAAPLQSVGGWISSDAGCGARPAP